MLRVVDSCLGVDPVASNAVNYCLRHGDYGVRSAGFIRITMMLLTMMVMAVMIVMMTMIRMMVMLVAMMITSLDPKPETPI